MDIDCALNLLRSKTDYNSLSDLENLQAVIFNFLYQDFQKVFEMVPHHKLLRKLHSQEKRRQVL